MIDPTRLMNKNPPATPNRRDTALLLCLNGFVVGIIHANMDKIAEEYRKCSVDSCMM
jgi:hypothetical protein